MGRPVGRRVSPAWLRRLGALGGFDLSGEVADARVERGEDAADRAPVCAALAALQAADERRIDAQAVGELFLRHPGVLAQRAEGLSEDQLVLLCCHFCLPSHGPEHSRHTPTGTRVFLVRFSW